MGTGDLLQLHPSELIFPLEVGRPSSCTLQLTSLTYKHVAFKVKTNNPSKYSVRPNIGIVVPGTTFNVSVTMQPQLEDPLDLKCNDKFLIQCVVTNDWTKATDINSDMFKEPGKTLGEFKIDVVYTLANISSPVPEEAKGSLSPKPSMMENDNRTSALLDNASRYLDGVSNEQSPNEIIPEMVTSVCEQLGSTGPSLNMKEAGSRAKEEKFKNQRVADLAERDEMKFSVCVQLLSNGKMMLFDLKNWNTISTIKENIEIEEGIPVNRQVIIQDGNVLEDDILVGLLKIPQGISIINLMLAVIPDENLEIFIGNPEGRTSFKVKSWHPISYLKHLIYDREGIPRCEQRLFHGEKQLREDSKTLKDYEVIDGSTIHLMVAVIPGENLEIFIKTLEGRTVSLRVKSWYTLSCLKELIYHKEGVPCRDQHLIYGGKQLAENSTLKDYGVTDGSTIQLVLLL